MFWITVCVPMILLISRLCVLDTFQEFNIFLNKLPVKQMTWSLVLVCQSTEATREKLYEQLTTVQKQLFCLEQLSNLWYLASFYMPQFPSAQSWLCQSLRHYCCVVVCLHFKQFLAVPLTLGIFSLLPELGMHPVFLRNHQNQEWSLYAVEKAVWAAGLGHVLHASDKKKKYRHNAKVELTM